MDKVVLPQFENKAELFAYLVANKDSLMSQKKAITKFTDAVSYYPTAATEQSKESTIKENNPIQGLDSMSEISVKVVINTTNIMDSHSDVHLPGLWDKSLNENKSIMHLQEHKMAFDKIISEGGDLKAYVQNLSWGDLGQKMAGVTQALIFESKVRKDRNEFMFNQYGKGFVKQHSVGMRYVKLALAINDEDFGSEKEVWDKYIEDVANKEAAEENGFFWLVKEAKVIEGSAVPIGSNQITPTIENNKNTFEPSTDTQEEPPTSTPKNESEKGFFDNW